MAAANRTCLCSCTRLGGEEFRGRGSQAFVSPPSSFFSLHRAPAAPNTPTSPSADSASAYTSDTAEHFCKERVIAQVRSCVEQEYHSLRDGQGPSHFSAQAPPPCDFAFTDDVFEVPACSCGALMTQCCV